MAGLDRDARPPHAPALRRHGAPRAEAEERRLDGHPDDRQPRQRARNLRGLHGAG